MYLRSFDKNGNAEITITESEINALCNALCEYCKTEPKDKRVYELHERLYILYEVIHHGACFDDTSIRIIQKLRDKSNEVSNKERESK